MGRPLALRLVHILRSLPAAPVTSDHTSSYSPLNRTFLEKQQVLHSNTSRSSHSSFLNYYPLCLSFRAHGSCGVHFLPASYFPAEIRSQPQWPQGRFRSSDASSVWNLTKVHSTRTCRNIIWSSERRSVAPSAHSPSKAVNPWNNTKLAGYMKRRFSPAPNVQHPSNTGTNTRII